MRINEGVFTELRSENNNTPILAGSGRTCKILFAKIPQTLRTNLEFVVTNKYFSCRV